MQYGLQVKVIDRRGQLILNCTSCALSKDTISETAFLSDKYKNVLFISAREGSGGFEEMQDIHEAYQVLLKVIRAKNTFIKKAREKREANMKAAESTATAAAVFKKKTWGTKLNIAT